jgi:hypothetical protein
MDLSPAALLTSMLIGAVGFGLFLYGKRAQRLPQLLTGIVLSVFPFFVGGVAAMIGITVALLLALTLALRAGF